MLKSRIYSDFTKHSPKVGSFLEKMKQIFSQVGSTVTLQLKKNFRKSRLFSQEKNETIFRSSRLFIDFRADLWEKTFRFYDEEIFSKSRLFSRKNEISFLTSRLFMLWIKRRVVFWRRQSQLAQGQLITQKTSHEKSALQSRKDFTLSTRIRFSATSRCVLQPRDIAYDDISLRRGHDIREAALLTDTHEQTYSRTHSRLIFSVLTTEKPGRDIAWLQQTRTRCHLAFQWSRQLTTEKTNL